MLSVAHQVSNALQSFDLQDDLSTPISGMNPRDDQIASAAGIIEWLANENEKGLIFELPTGGGKTLVAQMAIRWLVHRTQIENIAFLVSRRELLNQTKKAMTKSFGKGMVNITAGSKHDTHRNARIRLFMEQTISSKIRNGVGQKVVNAIETSNVVFVDECHHTYYQTFADKIFANGGRLVGLSATPDDWRLLEYFQSKKVLGIPQVQLEQMTPRVLASPVMLVYSQEAKMASAVNGIRNPIDKEKVRYGLIRETIVSEMQHAEMKVSVSRREKGLPSLPSIHLRWMIKVTRKEHARDLADHLTQCGIHAKAFISGSGGGTKQEIDHLFEGKLQYRVAIVVHRFTVGYDHPGIQGLILTNETGYPTFVQSVGRVLRTGYPPSKDEAYILDMAGNWSLHRAKYLSRRESPSLIIPPKVEYEEGTNGAERDGPGRPDAKDLGNLAVVTLPGIKNTGYEMMDRAILLAYCATEATEYIRRSIWHKPKSPEHEKEMILHRAIASYWFITDDNIIKNGNFKTQRTIANDIIMTSATARHIWMHKTPMPEEILKRLLRARRKFSKTKRGA